MNFYLAIDPDLELAVAELAVAWNGSDYSGQAEASIEPATAASFPMGEVTVLLLSAAASIPATVIATFITDFLKRKFPAKKPPVVEVTTISTPDGEPLFIIRKSIEHPES
jgi:hypothetical protein